MLKNRRRSKKFVTFRQTENSPCAFRAVANQKILERDLITAVELVSLPSKIGRLQIM
jgi:hypothetical protein